MTETIYRFGSTDPYFVVHEHAIIGHNEDGAVYGPRLSASFQSTIMFEPLLNTSEAEIERGKEVIRQRIQIRRATSDPPS